MISSDASICVKYITGTNLIILNGSSYDDTIYGDLDVYKYNVINMVPMNDFYSFIILCYTIVAPDEAFPYNYMQFGYVYTIDIQSGKVTVSTKEITFACFCYPKTPAI